MGMFPVQNYGDDFNKSFIGMGSFINGINKTADDKAQRDIENTRADRTLAAQEASSNASVQKSTLEADKLRRENEQATLLRQATPVYSKVANGEPLNNEDVDVLGKMRVNIPYLANNIDDNKALQDAHSVLISANEKAKSLPQSDTPFKFQRGDSPETDKVLDAWNLVVSPDRHKTHIDSDGSVTGTKGAEYTTDQIQAGAGVSTAGGAKTAAFFSIVDSNGDPIYQTDAQGQPIPQRKLVASSVGQTNDPNSPVNFVPADALIMKSKLALEQLQAESTLTPTQRAKLKKDIEVNMYGLMPNGAEKLLASQVKDNTPIALPEGSQLIDKQTGEIIAKNPKTAQDVAKTVKVDVGNGKEQTFQWNSNSQKFDIPVGSPGIKFNPRPEQGGNSDKDFRDSERLMRADIDKSAAELARRRVQINRNRAAANASRDPDAIAAAISAANDYNDESAALTAKFSAYQQTFHRNYTPTAVPNPGGRSGKASSNIPSPSPPPQKKTATTSTPVYAVNPQTKQRIMSYDGGKSWQPAR